MTPQPATITAPDLANQAGITYRQLDYWTNRHYLHADTTHPGTGTDRHYPEQELTIAERMARLTAVGFTPAIAAHLARTITKSHRGNPDNGWTIHLGQGLILTTTRDGGTIGP